MEEFKMGWKMNTIFALYFISMVITLLCAVLLISRCAKKVQKTGLKNIVDDIWEGDKKK